MKGTKMKWSVLSFLVLFVSAFNSFSQEEDYSQWAHSRDISINTSSSGYSISQEIRDFPYLVRLDKEEFDFSQAKENGEDIRFANSSGAHLPYHIDSWDKAGKSAAVWVKADVILGSDSNQFIKMHWGKSDAADSSNSKAVFETGKGFVAVWHFSTTGTLNDATANALNLTNNFSTETNSSLIGEGRSLDGAAGANLSHANNPAFNIKDNLTLSAWVKPVEAGEEMKIMGKTSSWPPIGYIMGMKYGRLDPEFWDSSGNNFRPAGGKIESRKWNHLAVTWTTGGKTVSYINGTQVSSIDASTESLGVNDNLFYVGVPGFSPGALSFRGDFDEFRVIHAARSADWIKLCYLNQKPSASAPPTIEYPEENILLQFNSPVEINPTVTGVADSITITPSALPMGLFFDIYTGSITGYTMSDFFTDTFFITASNAKGSCTDTIIINVVPVAITTDNRIYPDLFGLKGSDLSKIFFSVPSTQKIQHLTFNLYNCKGAVIWSVQLDGTRLKPGIQSCTIEKGNNPGTGMYLLEMKVRHFGLDIDAAKYVKTVIVK